MKNLTFYSVLLVLLVASCKQEEKKQTNQYTIGDLTISKDHPMPGDKIDIMYMAKDDVDAFYYYMVGSKAYPVDLYFTSEDNNEMKSNITIPDSATALAFNFKVDDVFDDNNKEGYLISLYNDDGSPLAGSKASMANYTLNYGSEYGVKKEKATLLSAIKSDLENHPELMTDWEESYLRLEYQSDKASGEKIINEKIAALESKATLSEKEYKSLITYYGIKRKRPLADSISKVVTAKYPKSEIAKSNRVNAFFDEQDLAKREAIFKSYMETYGSIGDMGNYMANTLASTYAAKNDSVNFNHYAKMMTDKSAKASLYNGIAWPLAEKGEDLKKAERLSKTSLELMKAYSENSENKPNYSTEKQFKKNMDYAYNMYSDTYALILFKQGKIKDAISHQETAIGEGKNSEMNERYVNFLMADKQFDKAETKITMFIKSGFASPKIVQSYKMAYTKNNPTAKDVDAKLADLQKVAHNRQLSEIKKTMMDEEAPNFKLKDMKGNDVELTSLKGKTVILDFWATWCGPCKASFPGMQEVVTKYKNDENVVLLFVDTFEGGENRSQLVEDFIAKNKYDFHVVYDNEDNGSYEVADKYGITGIPTKVVIGPDGKMKFKAVGYSGQTEKLVTEMDMMIEILKP